MTTLAAAAEEREVDCHPVVLAAPNDVSLSSRSPAQLLFIGGPPLDSRITSSVGNITCLGR